MFKSSACRLTKSISFLLCLVFCTGLFSLSANAAAPAKNMLYETSDTTTEETNYYQPNFDLQAPSAIVVNIETGFPLYEKEPDLQFPAASLVKLITALIVRSQIEDLDTATITAQSWVFDELWGKEASHADIWKGETLNAHELLYALLLPSGNEAALMLASLVASGYVANFVRMMNSKAAALGCTGTYFADPMGLSTESVTTARDMALIMREFIKDDVLVQIAATSVYEMAPHNHSSSYYIHSTNRLLVSEDLYTSSFSGVAGVVKAGKTGNLGDWQNFVSYGEKNDLGYIVVVMQSPNGADSVGIEHDLPSRRPALVETARLYQWVFGNFELNQACDTSMPIYDIPVKYSTDGTSVHLSPAAKLMTILPKNIDNSLITMQFNLPTHLAAPVKQGDIAGTASIYVQGKYIGDVELVIDKNLSRNQVLFVFQKILEFFSATFFKVFLVYVLIFAGIYIAFVAKLNNDKKKRIARRNIARQQQKQKKPPSYY